MGKSSEAPQSPNPEVTIPMQGAENRRTADYTAGLGRVNESSPWSTTTWSSTPQFDSGGYERAIQQYLSRGGTAPSGGWYQYPGSSNPAPSPVPGAPNPTPGAPQPPSAPWAGTSNPWSSMPNMHAYDAGDTGGSDPGGGLGSDPGGGPSGAPGGGPNDQIPPAGSPGGMGTADTSGSGLYLPNPQDYFSNQWTRNVELSPEQQALYQGTVGNQQKQVGLAGDLLSRSPMDISGLGSRITNPGVFALNPTSITDRSAGLDSSLSALRSQMAGLNPLDINQQASDAVYNSASRYLDPQFQQDQREMEGRLADQGFVPGTPAYQQAMDSFRQSKERAYADARDRATTQGASVGNQVFGNSMQSLQQQIASLLSGANFGLTSDLQRSGEARSAQNQQFGQGMQLADFGNTQRDKGLTELMALRQLPINELNAISNGTQMASPQIGSGQSGGAGMNPTDIMGAYQNQYMGQLGQYNAGVSQDNATMGLMGTLATALAMY